MRRRRKKPEQATYTSEVLPSTAARPASRQDSVGAREREKRSAGRGLDRDVRQKMERLLKQDFGQVVIHSDSNANRAAESRRARAYVRGRDIYFGRAEYNPQTEQGLKLLAHELIHVAQTDAGASHESEAVSRPEQAIERQANAATAGVLQGQKAAVNRSTASGILRETTEEAATPSMSVHPYDITSAHSSGVINAGSFSVSFRYRVNTGSGETVLVLEIPDGVSAVFAPLSEIPRGAYRVDDPGGDAARTIKIHVQSETGGIPAIQTTFSNGTDYYLTVFKFPG